MHRREFLATCNSLTAVAAGCLGAGLPAECPRSPAVDGLPERPAELNHASATEFLREYEYTIAPTRDPAQTTLRYVEHVRTERVDDGYRVHFFVEPADEPSTAESTPASPTPAASGTYSVAYYIDDRLIKRQTRIGPTSYTGLRPQENGTLLAC